LPAIRIFGPQRSDLLIALRSATQLVAASPQGAHHVAQVAAFTGTQVANRALDTGRKSYAESNPAMVEIAPAVIAGNVAALVKKGFTTTSGEPCPASAVALLGYLRP
jgi:hypothetical protein